MDCVRDCTGREIVTKPAKCPCCSPRGFKLLCMSAGGGAHLTRPSWIAPTALFVVALATFVPTAAGHHANWDPYASSLSAWRIATTGQPWMDGVDFSALSGVTDPSVWQAEVNGHLVTTRMFGPILAAVPFYWFNSYGTEADFSIYRGGVAAAVFVAAAVLFLFFAVRRRIGDAKALVGAAVFGFTTPAWSVGANALWTHPMTMFGLAGAAWASSRDRWWLAGVSLGIGMWARPHLGLAAAVIGVGLAWSRKQPQIVIAFGVPTSLSLVMLGAWNHYVFSTWNPLGVYAGHRVRTSVSDLDGQINQLENVAGFLVSPDRGFLVWTPVVLVLMPAVVRSWKHVPDWSRWLALGGLAYTVLQLGLNYYGGADAFYGYRHGLELLVCITPLFTLSIDAVGVRSLRIAAVVVALQFAMIAPGSVFEAFYVGASDVWVDNSFLFAVRSHPLVFGPFTAICCIVGWQIGLRIARRGPASAHEDVGVRG